MRHDTVLASFISLTLAASGLWSCSGATGSNSVQGGGGGSAASTGTGGSGAGSSGGGFNLGGQGSGGGNPNPPCSQNDANLDNDGDGFTPAQGDCNDCSTAMNPGAYDFPGDGVDQDCDGTKDNEPTGCDSTTVDIGYTDPVSAIQALGICRQSDGKRWGYVPGSAKYVKANGVPGMNDLSHGLLSQFGPNVKPREGSKMLALSSGTARAKGDPGFRSPQAQGIGVDMNTSSPTPQGWPVAAPSCPNIKQNMLSKVANDPAALEFQVKVPTNAKSVMYDFTFYTYEFPDYICSPFNDFFVALMNPPPPNAQNSNISFDIQGNPVSVNNGLLEVCQPQNAGGKYFACPQGTAELAGTGFDEMAESGPHAATGWLRTQAQLVEPGGIVTFRFAIWDAGDHILNSTVLIDNMTWSEDAGHETPVTEPVPK
ncbi:MAG: choice-of-anchor L domain-containing protein [Sorangiineae bacterium]|nr:choice-of-anchor L domain-containing protein [Polyangiaceae bacterium]MEB2321999.1 choice-of-anchor L domain-containing protein [Sorangiineae bacterium]